MNFWYQEYFHGVNLSSLRSAALTEYFRQPIVDTFDVNICTAKTQRHVIDFQVRNIQDIMETILMISHYFRLLMKRICTESRFRWSFTCFRQELFMELLSGLMWLLSGPTTRSGSAQLRHSRSLIGIRYTEENNWGKYFIIFHPGAMPVV